MENQQSFFEENNLDEYLAMETSFEICKQLVEDEEGIEKQREKKQDIEAFQQSLDELCATDMV